MGTPILWTGLLIDLGTYTAAIMILPPKHPIVLIDIYLFFINIFVLMHHSNIIGCPGGGGEREGVRSIKLLYK